MRGWIWYPTRCRIIDIAGKALGPGIVAMTPAPSKPHIGKKGVAEEVDGVVRITLDDGTVLYGWECWWKPIADRRN